MKTVYNVILKDAPLKQLSGSRTLFKKQLIRFGEWEDPLFPDERMTMDMPTLESFASNFRSGVVGRIPVPLGHPYSPDELVRLNKGEAVEMAVEGTGENLTDGLYGILEIRDQDTVKQIEDETLFDVSISFTDNYQDTESGKYFGPAIIHVGLVNNPYIKKMSPFAALAESLSKQFGGAAVHMLSESNSKEIGMHKITNDRDFAVEVPYTDKNGTKHKVTLDPGKTVDVQESEVEIVQKALADATVPEPQETDEQKAEREKQEADTVAKEKAELEAKEKADLSEKQKLERELADTRAKLKQKEIDESYQTALQDGKIVPAQETAYRALAESLHDQTRNLSDGKTQKLSELLAEFIAKAPKVVSLNNEKGKHDDPNKGPVEKLSEESKQGLKKMRVSEEDYAKYGANESVSINDLGGKNE